MPTVVTLPLALLSLVVPVAAQATLRVSLDSNGVEAFDFSGTAAVSGDGRIIAFASRAPLVPDALDGDGGALHVYVHDRGTGTTELVSVSSAGLAADADCLGPSVSTDGRFVTFRSAASNLVANDTNGASDVFLFDRQARTTERISVDGSGQEASGESFYGSLSSDGRWIAFQSDAPDLTPGDTNQAFDVFVHDRQTGATELVSVGSDGQPAGFFQFSFDPSIAADGRAVAFGSIAASFAPGEASGLGDVYVRDLDADTTELVSRGLGGAVANGASSVPSLSADGRFVVFASHASNLVADDTNGVEDVFVHDRGTQQTTRVSVASDGTQANERSYLYYVQPSLSADGRYVVFESYASNLAAPDVSPYVDVFRHDRWSGTTELVTQSSGGQAGHLGGSRATISRDGTTVVFESDAPTLVAGDSNGVTDVFVRALDSTCAPIEAYCDAKTSSLGCRPRIAALGQPSVGGAEAFGLSATALIAGQPGALVLGFAPDAQPFAGGLLCVAPPLVRLPPQVALDVPNPSGVACTGAHAFPFDAATWSQLGALPGTTLFGQWTARDPGDPDGVGLSDGIRFTACP